MTTTSSGSASRAPHRDGCPPREQLADLLAELLDGPVRAAVEAHVNGCPSCLAQLDQMTQPTWLGPLRPEPTGSADDTAHLLEPLIKAGPLTFLEEAGRLRRELGAPSLSGVFPLLSMAMFPGYDVLGELGRGGMGVVYKARDKRLKRLVAIKTILAAAAKDRQVAGRFRQEAKAVARLRHPNIVQIYEIGGTGESMYVVLEYVPGGSLKQRCGGAPQDIRDAATLIAALADAVEFAHRRGIIHRDLKPANILLDYPQNLSGDGPAAEEVPTARKPSAHNTASGLRPLAGAEPKISDFGLAKLKPDHPAYLPEAGEHTEDLNLTVIGQPLGTPQYMAPEQANSDAQVGPPADIWALGALLYELLTGKPPHQGPTPVAVIMKLLTKEPEPPRRLRPRLPEELELICLRCLERDPTRRYASAAALADDLRHWLAGEPVSVKPLSGWGRTLKWMHRHPRRTAAAAAAVLLTLLGWLILGLLTLKAWSDLDEAERRLRERSASPGQHRRTVSLVARSAPSHRQLRRTVSSVAPSAPQARGVPPPSAGQRPKRRRQRVDDVQCRQ